MKNWVVYLTVYKGNKMPMFYIGVSYDIESRGYRGSPKSKEYKEIWKKELKYNASAFKTIIIKSFGEDKIEAYKYENYIQDKLKVDINPLYINKSINGKTFGAYVISGSVHHNYDNKKYEFINMYGKKEIATQREMIIKYKLNQSSVSQLINKKLKSTQGWILFENAEKINDILNWREKENAPTFNGKKYIFINKNGIIIEETKFHMKNNLKCKDIWSVCNGNRMHSNGWFLYDDLISYDENIKKIEEYFKNSKIKNKVYEIYVWSYNGGEIVEHLSPYDLCVKYGLDRSHITKLINKKLKKTKGWELIYESI